MQRVFVLDRNKNPLMPCHPARAKELLKKGKAAVFRRYPFTIILKFETGKAVQPVAFKVDPGSKTTGVAVVADFKRGKIVVWGAEVEHRGGRICDALLSRRSLRRGRRNRKCRYRQPRFLNRTKRTGWLPPSLESRITNIETWQRRISILAPISSISMELVKFDTQKMVNAEISGVEYQQGDLQGYEIREYLLEKWERQCAYCKIKNVPLEIEHIIPKTRGGSNRVSNLTLACHKCNQKKGTRTAEEFGHNEIQKKAKLPLKDAAAVNTTRWTLYRRLGQIGLPVETGTGGRTKFNRTRLSLPKAHWIDAACVGESGADVQVRSDIALLYIKAMGHGCRQRCRTDKYGFPRTYCKRGKTYLGWQTGDIAKAVIPNGKNAGVFTGRIAIRHRPSFMIGKIDVNPRHLIRLHNADGYAYNERMRPLSGLKSDVSVA